MYTCDVAAVVGAAEDGAELALLDLLADLELCEVDLPGLHGPAPQLAADLLLLAQQQRLRQGLLLHRHVQALQLDLVRPHEHLPRRARRHLRRRRTAAAARRHQIDLDLASS